MNVVTGATEQGLRRTADKAVDPTFNDSAGGTASQESSVVHLRPSDADPLAVPAEVASRFVRVGSKFFDRLSPESIAFEDFGGRLETRSDSDRVGDALIDIAAARGWERINVAGSEAFRRNAWLKGSLCGIQVAGYRATDADRARLLIEQHLHAQTMAGIDRSQENDAGRVSSTSFPTMGRDQSRDATPPKNADMDVAFDKSTREQVLKRYPELEGAYEASAAIDKRLDADDLLDAQKAVVRNRVRRNIVESIRRGESPLQHPHARSPEQGLDQPDQEMRR